MLSELDHIEMFAGDEVDYDEDSDECHPKDFKDQFQSDDAIFFVRDYMPIILTVGGQKWPSCVIEAAYPDRPKNYLELFRSIIVETWGEDVQESEDERPVGSVCGTKIERRVTTFWRPDREIDS